ncbi:MAG: DNA-binding protein [Bdellovibrionaceae bacterium]|nr:DNA-binding protein [Bdellovibrionales bacterium]MCB9086574.1 DNA-binding protein [Pseudobdellovibrionaceae bacterium]
MERTLVLVILVGFFTALAQKADANNGTMQAQIQCSSYLGNNFRVHQDNTYYNYNDDRGTETFRLGANSCLPQNEMSTYKALHQDIYHYQRYMGKSGLANNARTEIVQFMLLTADQQTDCRDHNGGIKCTWKDGRGNDHAKTFSSLNADLVNMRMDKAVKTKWEITQEERAEQSKKQAEEAEKQRVATMEEELETARKRNQELTGQINRMHAQLSNNPQCRINAGNGSSGTGYSSGSGTGSSSSSISAYARTYSATPTSGGTNPTAFVNTDSNDGNYLDQVDTDSNANFKRTPASTEKKQ